MQWGYIKPSTNNYTGPISFHVAFAGNPVVICKEMMIGTAMGDSGYARNAQYVTSTTFSLQFGAYPNYPVGWIAIGL